MALVKIKKQKAQKKCVIKRKLKFENYKKCLEATQRENETEESETLIFITVLLGVKLITSNQ